MNALQHVLATASCGLRPVRRRQVGDQGRMGTLLHHPRDRRHLHGRPELSWAPPSSGGAISTAISDWDAGESNLDVNGPDFLSRESTGATGALQNAVVNPDEQAPRTDEFMLQYRAAARQGLRGARDGDLQPGDRSIPAPEHQAAVRGVQHPDHEHRSGRGRGGRQRRRSGHDHHVLRLCGRVRRPGIPATDALQRSARGSELQVDGVRALAALRQQLAVPGVLQRDQDRRAVPDRLRGSAAGSERRDLTGNQTWEWGARMSGSYLFP